MDKNSLDCFHILPYTTFVDILPENYRTRSPLTIIADTHAHAHITYTILHSSVTLTLITHPDSTCFLDIYGKGSFSFSLHAHLAHNAQVHVRAAYIGTQTDTISYDMHYTHESSHATSSFIIKGFLSDHAQSRYTGMVSIPCTAPHSDAQQKHHVLTHGPHATSHSLPQMEVLNNTVRCSHGTAVGTFDNNALALLALRGIALLDAQKMLAAAFFTNHFTNAQLTRTLLNDIEKIF